MIRRQGQHRHDLDASGITNCSDRLSPDTDDDLTKRTITHANHARPPDPLRIEIKSISMKEKIIHKCREKIQARR